MRSRTHAHTHTHAVRSETAALGVMATASILAAQFVQWMLRRHTAISMSLLVFLVFSRSNRGGTLFLVGALSALLYAASAHFVLSLLALSAGVLLYVLADEKDKRALNIAAADIFRGLGVNVLASSSSAGGGRKQQLQQLLGKEHRGAEEEEGEVQGMQAARGGSAQSSSQKGLRHRGGAGSAGMPSRALTGQGQVPGAAAPADLSAPRGGDSSQEAGGPGAGLESELEEAVSPAVATGRKGPSSERQVQQQQHQQQKAGEM